MQFNLILIWLREGKEELTIQFLNLPISSKYFEIHLRSGF